MWGCPKGLRRLGAGSFEGAKHCARMNRMEVNGSAVAGRRAARVPITHATTRKTNGDKKTEEEASSWTFRDFSKKYSITCVVVWWCSHNTIKNKHHHSHIVCTLC